MAPTNRPLKNWVFLSGVMINAALATILLWAVGSGRGSRAILPLIIAMAGFGALQAISVLAYLCVVPGPPIAPHDSAGVMIEMEPIEFFDSDDENQDEH
ncbi:hypothetical protein AUEXF2481DRAFT_7620 [Aureobasidium subglaciale EXF-2481]|uniref:Uncharacterized protein n=1 Tax=Aureobasidium subglaciale (strain EXF-2481) TaxID=1043005 RepID=A0A074Y991_AURSE|nr:uncharacterized protein AUEXF2481DRAFT_7620 [Aureobasidium subglaciale EXF-2481]KEQ92544.1 hypothetical protein AUEXF2481DRAFT_7620 [Aureobasidium subglaciale EXF-2481]